MSLFPVLFATLATTLGGSALAGELEVITTGPLVADGVTESVVQLYHPEITARSRVRVRAEGGDVVEKSAGDDGSITLTLRPDNGADSMTLQVRLRRGFELEEEVVLAMADTYRSELSVSVEPEMLGPDDRTVEVRVEGAREPVFAASVGEFQEPERVSEGIWSARYSGPQRTSEPVSAILTVVDRSGEAEEAVSMVLPMGARRSETFTGPPGGRAVLFQGESELGPTLIAPAGTVAFDVAVQPGENRAELHTFAPGGNRTTEDQRFSATVAPQLLVAPQPDPLVVRGGEPLSICFSAVNASGELVVDVGAVGFDGGLEGSLGYRSDGVFCGSTTPPAAGGEFSATVSYGELSSVVTGLAVAKGTRVNASADPVELASDTTEVTLSVEAIDGSGLPQDGLERSLTVHTSGATARGRLQGGGEGAYTQTFRVTEPEHLLFAVVPEVELSNRPAERLRVWSGARGDLAPEGSVVPIFLVVEDALGFPVPNQRVELSTDSLGSMPLSQNTGPKGIGVLFLNLSPEDTGPVRVTGVSGDSQSSTFIWKLDNEALHLPVSLGSQDEVDALNLWKARIPVVHVRQAPVVEPVAVAEVVPTSEPVVVAEPVAEVAVEPTGEAPAAVAEEVPTITVSDEGGVATGSEAVVDPSNLAMRTRLGVVNAGRHYFQFGIGDDPSVPPTASFMKPLPVGVLGLRLSAERNFRSVRAEVDIQGGGHMVDPGSGGELSALTDVIIGFARGLPSEDGKRRFWGAWLHYGDATFMKYNSDRSALEMMSSPFVGLRVGAGAEGAWRALSWRSEITETFAPLPVSTDLNILSQFTVPNKQFAGRDLWGAVELGSAIRHPWESIGEGSAILLDMRFSVTVSAGVDL